MTYSLDDYSTSKVERCFVPHDLEKVFGHMSREEIEIHYMSSINSGCPKKGKFTLIGKATKGLHPGLFLQRELGIRKLKSGQFAESIGEHPQTLSSIIRGRRSMNTPLSLRIEQALGLEEGFLMTLQVYYDIAEEKRKLSQNHRPDLTKFRSTIVNGNQKCSDFGNSECSIFGIMTTVLLASAVQ